MHPVAGGCLVVILIFLGLGLVGKCQSSPDPTSYPSSVPMAQCTAAHRNRLIMLEAIAADTIIGGESISPSMRKRILRLREKCGDVP